MAQKNISGAPADPERRSIPGLHYGSGGQPALTERQPIPGLTAGTGGAPASTESGVPGWKQGTGGAIKHPEKHLSPVHAKESNPYPYPYPFPPQPNIAQPGKHEPKTAREAFQVGLFGTARKAAHGHATKAGQQIAEGLNTGLWGDGQAPVPAQPNPWVESTKQRARDMGRRAAHHGLHLGARTAGFAWGVFTAGVANVAAGIGDWMRQAASQSRARQDQRTAPPQQPESFEIFRLPGPQEASEPEGDVVEGEFHEA